MCICIKNVRASTTQWHKKDMTAGICVCISINTVWAFTTHEMLLRKNSSSPWHKKIQVKSPKKLQFFWWLILSVLGQALHDSEGNGTTQNARLVSNPSAPSVWLVHLQAQWTKHSSIFFWSSKQSKEKAINDWTGPLWGKALLHKLAEREFLHI